MIYFTFYANDRRKRRTYIIRCLFRDLLPLGYNLDVKTITNYKDFFDEDFNLNYTLKKVV